MILSLAAMGLALAAEPEETDELGTYRQPFDLLADRSIGTTSRPVEFNWRESPVMIAGSVSFLHELNNFNSARGGAMVRLPSSKLMLEFGLHYVEVWDTPSSRLLAFTPYRQPGRPDRLDVDFNVGLPLAEGVVTTSLRWFPAVQLVFNAYAGVRYSVYPTGYGGMRPAELGTALLSPRLTTTERENLGDDERLDSMLIDSGRYGLLAGFGNDVYFKPGLFLSPKVMFAVPILAGASETDLLFWADFSMSLGWAF